jgi:hypothetical protein
VAYRMRLVFSAGAAVAAVGLVSLAVACGSGSNATTPTAQTGFAAYTACLSQHGVTLPSNNGFASGRPSRSARPQNFASPGSAFPRPSGSNFGRGGGFGGGFGDQPPAGVDQATWEKALEACASLRPSFGPGGNGGANNSAFTAYRNCLMEHGVTLSQGPNQLSTSDPKVAAALAVCAPLRPTGGPRATPSPA